MVLCSIEGPSERARNRLAKTISERLLQCLAKQVWAPESQALLDDNAQLVVQGRLCKPGSLEEYPMVPIIDLVMLLHKKIPYAYSHVF